MVVLSLAPLLLLPGALLLPARRPPGPPPGAVHLVYPAPAPVYPAPARLTRRLAVQHGDNLAVDSRRSHARVNPLKVGKTVLSFLTFRFNQGRVVQPRPAQARSEDSSNTAFAPIKAVPDEATEKKDSDIKKENKEEEEMVEKTERQFDDGVVESDPQNTYLQVNP